MLWRQATTYYEIINHEILIARVDTCPLGMRAGSIGCTAPAVCITVVHRTVGRDFLLVDMVGGVGGLLHIKRLAADSIT